MIHSQCNDVVTGYDGSLSINITFSGRPLFLKNCLTYGTNYLKNQF